MTTTIRSNSDGSSDILNGTTIAAHIASDGEITFPQNKVPIFQAAANGTQTAFPNSVFTKVELKTEDYDTEAAFDNTTNYRFQPQVAGYYQINGIFSTGQTSGALLAEFRKNGVRFTVSSLTTHIPGVGTASSGSGIVYLNGSTDYIELYGYQTSGSSVSVNTGTKLSGFLLKAA